MKKFARSLMVTLTALCLSVCFLFAGCSKQAGTYVGVTLVSQKSIELKLKANDELEMTVGSTTKNGTWKVDEEDETKITFIFDGNESGWATYNEENKTLKIDGLVDLALVSANGATLTKK